MDQWPDSLDAIRKELDNRSLSNFLFHNTREAMALVLEDGTMEIVNTAFAQLLGYTPSQMEGMNFKDITSYKDDAKEDFKTFKDLLDGKIPHYDMVKTYDTKGKREKVTCRLRAIKYPVDVDDQIVVMGQVLPIDVLNLSQLPKEDEKRIIQMLVGRFLVENWKTCLGILAGISGISNIDRILGMFGG